MSGGSILEGDGGSTQFRLEAVVPGGLAGLRPESLVGLFVELDTNVGFFRGTVVSVEPYVDQRLGPGHWVVLRPGDPEPQKTLPNPEAQP